MFYNIYELSLIDSSGSGLAYIILIWTVFSLVLWNGTFPIIAHFIEYGLYSYLSKVYYVKNHNLCS